VALAGLAVLYLAAAAATAALAGWAGRPWGDAGAHTPGRRARWPPCIAVAVLTLLPLVFTVRGFLPGTTLAPTPLLAGVPPWAEAERGAAMEAEAAANPLLLDPLSQFLPWREAARRDLLFNPAQGGGAALLANGQSAVLFPTEVMARWLPAFRAATFSQGARLLLAAWGMFLLARVLLGGARGEGEPLLPALAAAFVWVGSGFLQVWRLHPHTLVAAVVPWLLLALLRLAREPGPRPAVALAVAGAMAVAGGHPETLLHALLFGLSLLAAVVLIGGERRQIGEERGTDEKRVEPGGRRGGLSAGGRAARRDEAGAAEGSPAGRRLSRLAGWGTAAALLAALLAAPLLLPFVDNLRVSSEWVLRRDSGTVVEVPPAESVERLRPVLALFALGDPRDGSWRGPENLAELAGGSLGAAALLLAFVALAAPGRRRLALALLALGLLGLAVSIHLPGLSRPFGAVPLLRESLLKRLSLWFALAVSLLAALGVDAWRLRRRRRAPAAAAGAGRAASGPEPAAAHPAESAARAARHRVTGTRKQAAPASPRSPSPVLFAAPGTPVRLRARALLGAVLLAVALLWAAGLPGAAPGSAWEWGSLVAALALLLFVPPRSRLAAPLLAAVLLLPRVALLADWIPAVGPTGFYPETLATRFVAGELAEIGPLGYRVAGLDAALVPHSAAFFGFPEARAYDPMTFAPYAEFLAMAGEPSAAGWHRLLDPAHPALDFLGVRWVFDHPSAHHRPGVEVAYLDRGALVYENPEALPRLFLPPRVVAHATPEEALAEAARIRDFAERVAVSGLDVGEPLTGRGVVLPSGPAELADLVVEPRRLRARVTAEAPALVATSQPAIPGWRIYVDGGRALELRVNGAFLGVVVDAGEHAVEMVYAPRSWTWGWVLFAAGAVLAVLLAVAPRFRRRVGWPRCA
jgi:hypothetical protein